MNRKQKRALDSKKNRKKLKLLLAEMESQMGSQEDDFIQDGDLVQLDVDRIMSRKEYPKMQEEYRGFVESSRGKTFTAHPYNQKRDGFAAKIELKEEPRWLFWSGDVILVESGG